MIRQVFMMLLATCFVNLYRKSAALFVRPLCMAFKVDDPIKSTHTVSTTRSIKFQNKGTEDVDSMLIKEETVFQGYRNVVRKFVKLPTGHNATYDCLSQRHESIVVFVWDSKTATTTLVREYHPGPHKYLFGIVAGMYEYHKHESPLQSAQHELEEEAHLQTDQWHSLLDTTNTYIPFDKYSNNRFYAYLALDCLPVPTPKPLDEEEEITILPNITYPHMMDIMQKGEMNVVSTFAILLGLRKLDELGIDYRKPSS
jgi:hypothetical protein